MKPNQAPILSASTAESPIGSLLYSRIGYEEGRPARLLLRGPTTQDGEFKVFNREACCLRGIIPAGRTCWQDHWREIELPADLGADRYRVEVTISPAAEPLIAEIEIGRDILWQRTWQTVSYEQAERRQRFSQKHQGKPLGWFDAGMHWQEANAHAAYLVGLCDLLDYRSQVISAEEIVRLQAQLINGADYLALLQDLGKERSGEEGPLVHQSFKIDHLILPSDCPKAAVAWARVAPLLAADYADKSRNYIERAKRALDWFMERPRHTALPGSGIPHGISGAWIRPEQFATPDLAQCVEAAVLLEDPRAFEWADNWLERQIRSESADKFAGLYGHFRLFESGDLTEKAWTHGFDPEGYGFNCGQTIGHHLMPLVNLIRRHPQHRRATAWRQSLKDYAYGYFQPACQSNPFNLFPLGWFEGAGLLNFAGLWHGCNGLYGRIAAQARAFAVYFDDPAFDAIADGNLQWIAGLNAGIRKDMLSACHLSSPDVPETAFVPVSMIHGIGDLTAGSWLNLRGAICNGFATGDQFVWDTGTERADDGPKSFTDEDWITHAGGWLSGIARLPVLNQKP